MRCHNKRQMKGEQGRVYKMKRAVFLCFVLICLASIGLAFGQSDAKSDAQEGLPLQHRRPVEIG